MIELPLELELILNQALQRPWKHLKITFTSFFRRIRRKRPGRVGVEKEGRNV